MSKKYSEYIGDIEIKYNNKLNRCMYNDCNNLKRNKLHEIEIDMGDLADYMSHINDDEKETYDQEEEQIIECECGNEIIFTYNPYKIIKKYF